MTRWEERMAVRARERRALHEAVEEARYAREWDVHWADLERRAIASRAGMTLGEAMTLLNAEPWACACIGPPLCCRYAFIQSRALQRGAHITAKLMADVAGGPT